MSYQLQLGNLLFASILAAPAKELLDVELASEHNIEVALVRSSLDRYVTSDWLRTKVRPNPNRPGTSVVLFSVVDDYAGRPLLSAEAPLRRTEAALATAEARTGRAVAPKRAARPAPPSPAAAIAAAPSEAPTDETNPSNHSPQAAQFEPEPRAAAPSEVIEMPRGQYERKPKQPGEKAATSFLFSDEDRLMIRVGGKHVELEREEAERLGRYMRRIGLVVDIAERAA